MLIRSASVAVITGWLFLLLGADASGQTPSKARFPAWDLHTHLGGVWDYPGKTPNFSEIVKSMNAGNIEVLVDFKAGAGIDSQNRPLGIGIWGSRVDERLKVYPASERSRFLLLANVPTTDEKGNFLGDSMTGYASWVAANFEDSIKRGAAGLKLRHNGSGENGWTFDKSGEYQRIDGPEFDLLWKKVQDLRVPCLMHFGMVYLLEYTQQGQDMHYGVLMQQRERVLRRYPRMLHIGAHNGCATGDFGYLAEMLERNPNYFAEIFAHDSKDIFATLEADEKQLFESHQDQIVMGTDYMEATMSWLKSYGQRLEMFLPLSEKWNLPQTVFQKYYGDNARKLYRRNTKNAAPAAHAGFAQVRRVGRPATLDGSGSLDFEGKSLTYKWRQVAGPRVPLAAADTVQPGFVPAATGTYVFELVVNDGQLDSPPHRVSVEVVEGFDIHKEVGGLVVLEAENYAEKYDRNGQSWKLERSAVGYSGRGYMTALPDKGNAVRAGAFRTDAPELEFKVEFKTPGTYAVIVRGSAPDTDGDTVHIGLDGLEQRLSDEIGFFSSGWTWVSDRRAWDRQATRTFVTLPVLNIADPGLHTINVWMAKDGLRLDKIVLARHMTVRKSLQAVYAPTGTGPAESSHTVNDVFSYGAPTPACGKQITQGVVRTPQSGRSDWVLTCQNAPPSTNGFTVLGAGKDLMGTSIAGVAFHVALTSPYVLIPATSDANGYSETRVPLMVEAGIGVVSQFVWFNTPTCGGTGLSASQGLDWTVQ